MVNIGKLLIQGWFNSHSLKNVDSKAGLVTLVHGETWRFRPCLGNVVIPAIPNCSLETAGWTVHSWEDWEYCTIVDVQLVDYSLEFASWHGTKLIVGWLSEASHGVNPAPIFRAPRCVEVSRMSSSPLEKQRTSFRMVDWLTMAKSSECWTKKFKIVKIVVSLLVAIVGG